MLYLKVILIEICSQIIGLCLDIGWWVVEVIHAWDRCPYNYSWDLWDNKG
jgi:hypothetical protein